MDAIRLHHRFCLALIVAVLLIRGSAEVYGQAPNGLPANWKQLPPAEQVKLLMQFYDPVQDKLVGNIDEEDVRTHAAKIIAGIDFTETALPYRVLDPIHWAADPKLSDKQQEQIRKALLSRQDDWHGRPYAEIKGKSMLMRRLKLSTQLRIHEGRRWALAGGKLSDVPVKDMTEAGQYFVDEEAAHINGSFGVHWEGQLTPPKTGNYRFSLSPINVNSDDGQYPIKVSMKVAVNGQTVVSADAPNWARTSTPIRLTADKAVPLKADYTAQLEQMPKHALHALLYWEGPDLEKSLIPSVHFTPPDGKGDGLRGTYTWTEKGHKKTLVRTDQAIDFAWTAAPISLFVDSGPIDEINNLYWDQTTSTEFTGWCENPGGKVRLHPFFQDPDATAVAFSSDRRRTFLNHLVLGQPALLEPVSAKQIVIFYSAFRFGAPDLALSVFGTWAVRHADLECDLPRGIVFDGDTRQALRRMAIDVSREMPPQAERLESEFLRLTDGRCCLPVAYTLTLAHLGKGHLEQWTKYLDRTLADPNLSGDQRVNWLLARSFAEEIRQAGSRLEPYEDLYIRATDGSAFLDEAFRVAEGSEVKIRVAKERAGRMAAVGDMDGARKVVDGAQNLASDETQKTSLAAWKQQIDGLKRSQASVVADNKALARRAYLTNLHQRRDQAAKRKDQKEIKRYDALIETANKGQ